MKHLKVYLPVTILIFLAIGAFILFKPTIANADPMGDCAGSYPFGLAQFYGYSNCNYFNPGTSQDPNQAGDVLSGGLVITNSTSSAELTSFEDKISNYLNGSPQDQSGAAFIIDTMLQQPASSSSSTIAYAKANLSDWEARLSEYNSKNLIEYNTPYTWTCGSVDSAYNNNSANPDDFYFPVESDSESTTPCGPSATINTISFFNTKGALLYRIDTLCGNPAGDGLPPLQTVTIKGSVDLKNTTTGVSTPVTTSEEFSVILLDSTDESNSTSVPIVNGSYSVTVPSGDHFSLSTDSPPTGYKGPYTDYQGAASFTDAASGAGAAYNCGPTNYDIQIAGTPSSTPEAHSPACADVASDSDYNFIYLNSSPGGGSCSNLSTSGTSPTFTASATYTVVNGVSYKSASFSWGDGTTTSGGTNSNGKITSAPHTYTSSGLYTVTATISFTSSSATVPNSSCTTTVTVGGGGGGGGGSGPVFTCAPGTSYDVVGTTNSDTPYIGADYPNASMTFTSTGNFESDSNNPYNDNLSQSVNESSQLFVSASNISSGATYNLTPGSGNVVGTIPLQTPVGIYQVSYAVQDVEVVPNPNQPTVGPTPQSPAPPKSYSKVTNSTTDVYTTTETPGDPDTAYYTKEVATTTYVYTKTTTTAPTKGKCIDFNLQLGQCLVYGPGTPGGTSNPVVGTTTSTLTTYYITWVSTPNVNCPSTTVQIGYQPYMKVYGGDVMAGSGFDSSSETNCTEPTSSIIGWNWPQPPSYSGAGDEFAAYGLGQIDGFATNQASSTATGIGLSFGNTTNNSPSGQLFGGSFGQVNCAPDFYGTMPASTTTPVPSVNTLQSKSYYSNGSLTINGGNVQDSQHPVIYVNGNVYIDSNIYLGTRTNPNTGESWASVSQIPSFELIVKGNIYIDPGVTNLDGIYVAQGGTIYDCATSTGPEVGSQYYNDCNNQLVVNGSFIASNVDLMRTTNSLYQSSNDSNVPTSNGSQDNSNAAEVFNYNPVIWLGLTSNNTSLDNYNSVISLPPVL